MTREGWLARVRQEELRIILREGASDGTSANDQVKDESRITDATRDTQNPLGLYDGRVFSWATPSGMQESP